MKSLVEILEGQANSTDKLTHHPYGHFYEELFSPLRASTESILEIGVAQGGSIRAWEQYFPIAKVYALDINEGSINKLSKGEWGEVELLDGGINKCSCGETQLEDERHWHPSRIQATTLDVGHETELNEWAKDKSFDIIIDDGSHLFSDIKSAFYILWPYLNPNGYYIIEDVAQSQDNLDIAVYFNSILESILINRYSAEAITFRPNMILLRKKRENDNRCPTQGTL